MSRCTENKQRLSISIVMPARWQQNIAKKGRDRIVPHSLMFNSNKCIHNIPLHIHTDPFDTVIDLITHTRPYLVVWNDVSKLPAHVADVFQQRVALLPPAYDDDVLRRRLLCLNLRRLVMVLWLLLSQLRCSRAHSAERRPHRPRLLRLLRGRGGSPVGRLG